MNTPVQMLETISADIIENTVLLETIYKNSSEDHETDCAIACLIRSMKKTLDTANEYINTLSDVSAPPQRDESGADIVDDVFHATITARKLEELAHIYNEAYFTDEDNGKPAMYMASVIFDYAIKVCSELKNIEAKLN
ncbi:TPA: hypothetical protein SHS77_004151 [Raoultella planticola]|jgi:hypothetical protein|uniref:hypothetical protein n=1 Tax=Klebsiella/Raoultella group TaxID=2890311 RepID=UPI0007CCB589|nr:MULTISPECIES: hypothetical protein [Klebsiella/Raoultella group]MBS6568230.1 hypothetical protein [Klebsiella michiganensis]DAY60264.1 MAG TPA: hypothetical protein [Caudoviricetes sp.]ELF4972515.1 hypothetical protein [Raoultella planticola]SBM03865.1 Uncharacterised protein [Klebsiella grimontii]VTM99774.1 Uncharacterised protein [Raoultella planticola]